MKSFFGLILVLSSIVACGPSYELNKPITLNQGSDTGKMMATSGDDIPAIINFNFMQLDITADWKSNSSAEQRSAIDAATALGLNGSTPSLSGGNMMLSDIASMFGAIKKTLPLKNISPVSSLIPSVSKSTSNVLPDTVSEVATPSAGKTTETFSMDTPQALNGRSMVWLPETGAYYGGPITISIEGCGAIDVTDAAITQGADGGLNHGQNFFFSGTDFKKGDAEWNNWRASVISKPGCQAQSLTIEYSR